MQFVNYYLCRSCNKRAFNLTNVGALIPNLGECCELPRAHALWRALPAAVDSPLTSSTAQPGASPALHL